MGPLLTPSEAAAYFRISERRLRYLERAGEVRALNFIDVAAERGDECLYAEAKGRTAAPRLDTDTAYGQPLWRMPPEEVGEARFGIIVPTEAKVAALRVSARVRAAL